ncbi:MAG: hypothetical protein ABJF65_00515 [Reichenbachiella sp.]|uniref:hypothetical protein n=1 Tax=Reichenbachiella sp. TaxID=2184521 RepID=UPI0032650BF5
MNGIEEVRRLLSNHDEKIFRSGLSSEAKQLLMSDNKIIRDKLKNINLDVLHLSKVAQSYQSVNGNAVAEKYLEEEQREYYRGIACVDEVKVKLNDYE